MKAPEGEKVFKELMGLMMPSDGRNKSMIGPEQVEGMMGMMGGFTVLRLTNLLGVAGNGVKLTKEQLLDLNAKLNAIPRV